MECIVKGTHLIIPEGTKKIGLTDICSYINSNPIEEILLPSTIEIIEDNTFFGLDMIEELIIPGTVKRVEKHAFCNIPKCKLMIIGETKSIPNGWDAEFAANVKDVCFVSKL